MKQFTLFIVLLLLPTNQVGLCGQSAGGGITIRELRCEYAKNPLGIDTPQPRFSWILESNQRAQMQSAYHVIVASSAEKLRSDIGDKWDSGKVASEKSVNIPYQGRKLSSGEKCYWKVRVWDKFGKASPPSKSATFEMGLLKKSDWQGKWIGKGKSEKELNYVAGRLGQAIYLNGKSESIKIGHYPKLKPDKEITISAWVKPGDDLGNEPPDQAGNWREIYRKEDGNARCLLAFGKTGEKTGLWLGLGISGKYTEHCGPLALEAVKDGRWHLVAAVYDGSAMRFYFDGREIASVAMSGPLDTSGSSPAYIGSSQGESEFFTGCIDDVRIYNRALSAEQVKKLAEGGDVRANLVGFWQMDGSLKNSVAGKNGQYASKSPAGPAPLLRKEFNVSGVIKRARVCMSGLGWSELYINGKKVGDHVLDPATTYYNNDQPFELGSRVLYVTYDVTGYLRKGQNAIGIMLGNGWYSDDGKSPGRQSFGDRPILLLQMNIEYTDGRTVSIITDKSWKTADGPITANEICLGEEYDARLEKVGWNSTSYEDCDWDNAVFADSPSGKLVSQIMPAVKVMKTIKPVKITQAADGVYVYDFGQHFSGWTRLRLKGPRGAQITIRHAGAINANGRLDTSNQGGAAQTDTYVLKGEGVEVWEPRFTLHGFRYAEVTDFPGTPTLGNLEGRFVRNSVEISGSFECSNPLLNQIHHNVCWTFMTSLQGIPQDAGERSERVGWLGDTGFVAEDYIYNFDTVSFWAKWLDDIKDSQRPNGDVPVVSPLHWRSIYSKYPCWKSTYPLIAWYLYQYYGDERILAEHYDGIAGLVKFLGTRADNYIISEGLGDHMEPDRKAGRSNFAPKRTPAAVTSTGYYYFDVWILAQAAKILGKTDDYERYSTLDGKIKNAFNEKFLNKQTNQYATGSQTSNAMALHLGLVPEDRQNAVLKNLVDDIMIKNEGHLSTGILGTNALEQILGEFGRADVMYEIATKTTYPSWGYSISKGATTVWESFEVDNHSLNMKMFGSTEKFFYKDLAGIGPAAPGFRKINIKPRIVKDLTYARASLKTVKGLVSSSWKKTDDSLILEVIIPVNSVAKVSVPRIGLRNIEVTENDKTIWKNGKFIRGPFGITNGIKTAEYVTFDVGSGSHRFRLKGQK
jgi:alpha-L-rhamnosidase